MHLPSRGLRLSATTMRNTGVFFVPMSFMRIFTDINFSKERGDYQLQTVLQALIYRDKERKCENKSMLQMGLCWLICALHLVTKHPLSVCPSEDLPLNVVNFHIPLSIGVFI